MVEKHEYDYSALNARIKKKYGTVEKFSKAMGLTKGAISMRMNNNSEWRQDDVFKAVHLLNIPERQVYSFFYTLKVHKA